MLPDYPEVKDLLRERMLEQAMKSIPGGVWSQLKSRRLFEGDKMGIMREDGTQEVNPLQKLEAGMEISLKDYEKLTPADMFKRLQEQMQDFQLKKSKALFDKLRKTTEEVGHVSNLHGQPLTGEFLIESYKKLHIDFEGDGTPRMPTIVCGSEAKQVFERAIKEIQDNPELARKFAAVIDEKRREWRDRESSRKLVG